MDTDVDKVKTIYQHSNIVPSLIIELLEARQSVQISQARGLCSRVYKISPRFTGINQDGQQLCIKRVDEDDQYAPHAVAREILAYSYIDRERKENGDQYIMNLVAAFKDESDDFTTLYDLVMPWYSCTLQDLLNEQQFQINHNGNGAILEPAFTNAEQTSAWQIAKRIQSPLTFVKQAVYQLFFALSFLHAEGIAHRDIKPSNILIKPNGSNDIQLIDFGTCFLSNNRYTPGDDGKGGLASEVGTGSYRAPECLLSPLNGYDPFKVDIWQAGVTLSEFFLPLTNSDAKQEGEIEKDDDSTRDHDDHLDWERALWSRDGQNGWTDLHERFERIQGHSEDFFSVIENHPHQSKFEEQEYKSDIKRQSLFEGGRGDLGLASSIFDILGLPQGDSQGEMQWPEAIHFQPSLAKLPFKRRLPREGGLKKYLAEFISIKNANELNAVLDVLQVSVQLSAKNRIEAKKAIEQLSN